SLLSFHLATITSSVSLSSGFIEYLKLRFGSPPKRSYKPGLYNLVLLSLKELRCPSSPFSLTGFLLTEKQYFFLGSSESLLLRELHIASFCSSFLFSITFE